MKHNKKTNKQKTQTHNPTQHQNHINRENQKAQAQAQQSITTLHINR